MSIRDIIFRGKRIENGEWVYGTVQFHMIDGDLTKTKQKAFITYDVMGVLGKVYRYTFEVIPETVGQYIGLTDRNVKKIFDGDILQRNDGREFIVEWGMKEECWAGWAAKWIDKNCYDIIYHSDYTTCEVIGNIHKGSEL